jgi:glutamyl-tRNA synthetase
VTEVRVRFAPSPTGELHIGGARTALFNYLFARSAGGTFILRIDDTDLERSRADYIDKLTESMRWLGLNWDDGPHYQSKRLKVYSGEAERLTSEQKAYRCYCTIDDLDQGREAAREEKKAYLYPGTCRGLSPEQEESYQKAGIDPVIRLITPDSGVTVVEDEIRGKVSFENAHLDDFIIIKSNGLPTYNFASIVDDMKMGITHVIRGEEHLSNTPRQLLCAVALGYKVPRFAHVPMILAPDRSKLSKRHGATAVEEFMREGYLPEALINYMALLGWSPGGEQELFTLKDLTNDFSLKRVNKTAAVYDTNKLAWINSHYIRTYNPDKLAEAAKPFFRDKNLINDDLSREEHEFYKKVIQTVKERAKTLVELAEVSDYFFSRQYNYDQKGVNKQFTKEDVPELLIRISDELRLVEPFNSNNTEILFNKLCDELGISIGQLIQPARLAITGRTGGPGLFEILDLLGQEETVERLEKAVDYIKSNLYC